jgi:AmiR/NasT family two-component response regulator
MCADMEHDDAASTASAVVIWQAQGILMIRYGITADAALARIEEQANKLGVDPANVAEGVVRTARRR